MGEILEEYCNEIQSHRDWLKLFSNTYATKWERLLKADPEAAICEAATRKLLFEHQVAVEPHDELSSGGPDFLCNRNERSFYVEATCIKKDGAIKATGLSKIPRPGLHGGPFAPLTGRIFYEMCTKTPQLRGLDAPCILAIGTLHAMAGHICFSKTFAGHILTGTPRISFRIDPERGRAVGDLHQTTDLHDSGFVRPDRTSPNSIEEPRRTISAVLLCSFGTIPPRAIGLLHPNPNHNFDRTLLPKIEFCRLGEGYQSGQLKVEWI